MTLDVARELRAAVDEIKYWFRWHSALHEAGHAVAVVALLGPAAILSARAHYDGGRTRWTCDRASSEQQGTILRAGEAAVDLLLDDPLGDGPGSAAIDVELARALAPAEGADAWFDARLEDARALLVERREWVLLVAQALYERGQLAGDEIRSLIDA